MNNRLMYVVLLAAVVCGLNASKNADYENSPLRKFRKEQQKEKQQSLPELYKNEGAEYGELPVNPNEFDEYKKNCSSFYDVFIPGMIISNREFEEGYRKKKKEAFEKEKKDAIFDVVDDSVTSQDFDDIDFNNLLFQLSNKDKPIEQRENLLRSAPKALVEHSKMLLFISSFGTEDERIKFLKVLLKRGVQLEKFKLDSAGNTMLHIEAKLGADKVVAFMLEIGVDPEVKNRAGLTPIGVAYESGLPYTMILLLNYGAVCNKEELLSWAIRNKYVDLIRALVNAGVRVKKRHIKNMQQLGPKTQGFLTLCYNRGSLKRNVFEHQIFVELHDNDCAEKNMSELLAFAGSRDIAFVIKLYEVITFYFPVEERKLFNFGYSSPEDLSLDVLRKTKNFSKRKNGVIKLFDFCTGKIFEAGEDLTDFEKGVKELVEDKKLFPVETSRALKGIFERKFFEKQLKNTRSSGNFIDFKIKFADNSK